MRKCFESIAFHCKIPYNEHMFENIDTINFIKKNITIFLIGLILLVALILYVISQFSNGSSDQIIVLVDGREQGVYSLQKTQEIRIETTSGNNLLVIENGQAYVREADCNNQVCVHTQPINKNGGQIICLPHQVVIRLKNAGENEIDAVTN